MKLVRIRENDAIEVIKIVDDSEFITSDNPVTMIKEGGFKNPFDIENIIRFPLTNKHLVILHHTSLPSIRNKINRRNERIERVLSSNSQTEESCERVVIGSQKSIDKHQSNYIKYSETSAEGASIVQKMELKLATVEELYNILERNGGQITNEYLEYLKKIRSNELLKDEVLYWTEQVREKGFDI